MKGSGVDIELDVDRTINELTKGLSDTSKAVDKAISRAIRKTMRWLSSQVLRLLVAETGIPRKALKGRVIQTVKPGQRFGQVWIGLSPIDAAKVGKAKQTSSGVKVGRRDFDHAFLATVNGSEKVFRRRFRGPGSSQQGRDGGRLPIDKVTIPISEKGREVANRLQQRAESRFREILEQELNYAVLHER